MSNDAPKSPTTYTAEELAAMSLPDRRLKKPPEPEEVWHHGWLEGMLMRPSGERVGLVDVFGVPWFEGDGHGGHIPCRGQRPDEDDPATKGCLLELVRRAWGPAITVAGGPGDWTVRDRCSIGFINESSRLPGVDDYPTEFGALKAALDAAPVKP